ncbi:TPA: VENN motif pre-toxin domain-containing protein, partial [Neisseria meningitidis]
LGASASISGKTLGQGAQNKPQNKHLTSVADKNGASSSVGYGSDQDSQSSITKSGINTQNIQITDEAAQIRLTGKTAAQTKADIDTNVTTDTAERHSGSLKNVFDKDRVQSELDLQRTVSQDFSKNVQQANTEINQHLDKLKADKEAAETAAAEALANGDMETAKRKAHEAQDAAAKADNWQQGKVILNMLASGLAAPTQSGAGIAAATASPAVSYAIGQHFKDLAGQNANGKLTASQETAHVLAHAVLGAAVAAAGNNNALAGALSAGGSEAAAPYISKWLYGKEKGSDLTAEEKETVTAITNVLGTATGAAVGNSATDGAQGSLNAQSAVGNNAVETVWDIANIGIGATSLTYNVTHGNYRSAALDAVGLLYDVTATAVPFLPAGASAAIKGKRAGNSVKQSLIIGKDVANATKAANKAAKSSKNITSSPSTTGTKIHQKTGELLGENNGTAKKLSSSASSYFKGANKATGKQPDLSWKGTGVWADLTTAKQWNAHTRKYKQTHGQGIPIIYIPGKGVINKRIPSIGGTISGVNILNNHQGDKE